MKNIKLVIFDLDGVLVDACELHYKALNDALIVNNKPVINIEDHLNKYNGLPTTTKLIMLGCNIEEIKKINADKQQFTLSMIKTFCKKRQEKIDLIKYLKNKKIIVGCVTNSIRKTTKEMLERTGIYDMLDFCITNEDVSAPKPDPEGYLNIILNYKNIINSIKDQVIIVEDSPKGIQAAIATGAHVIKVDGPDDVDISLFDRILVQQVERSNINLMRGGWFVGDFEPSLSKSKDFEVGYRCYKKGEQHDTHYHTIAKEINCVARGSVEVCGEIYKEGDIFIVHPFKVIKPNFIEDTSIICVKIPSVPNDKYVIKDI